MKKMFKLGCLGLIALVVLGIVVSIFVSNDDDSTTTTAADPGKANTVVDTAKQEDKKEEKKLATIGEELQVGDVTFKVNKISTTKEIKDGDFFSFKPDSDGSVFLVVNVTVGNKGKDMINTDSSYFNLLKGEIEYAPTTLITTSNEFFLYEGINPGLSQTGNIAFEIPENEKEFLLNVQTGFWGTEQGQIQLY